MSSSPTSNDPIEIKAHPLGLPWWKNLTLSRIDRTFSVAGQVDASIHSQPRRASLSLDTMTLLVFIHQALPMVRMIRVDKIVDAGSSELQTSSY